MIRYSDELIEEIKNSNDIVDTISQYVTLKRSGRNFFGLCPFHKEKSPSFSVSPDKQIFHCFGCHVGGNVIHFVSKIENIDFKETIELLAEKSGINLPKLNDNYDNEKQALKNKVYEINKIAAMFYHENLYKPTSKQAQEYIKKRKLDNRTLKTFLIGYSGNFDELYKILIQKGFTQEEILASCLVNKTQKGQFIDRFRKRIMFPIVDTRNRVIAFGGRVLDDSKPKYINSPENIVYSKGRNLYALNVAKNSDIKKIIIVEGYMDVVSLYQRGIENVVASLGTALTEAQGRLLRRYSEKIIIGYDSDGAGQAATLRGLEILQSLGCDVRVLQISGAKDPDEYVIKFGSGRFLKAVEDSISLVEFKVKTIKNELNLENINDKIKFLNKIVEILTKVDNPVEREIYIEKISKDYRISKEAIFAQINKLEYQKNSGSKILDKPKPIKIIKKIENKPISETILKREKMLLSLLINFKLEVYSKIKGQIQIQDIKDEKNKIIIEKLYEKFEIGDDNIENIIDNLQDEEITNRMSELAISNFEIKQIDKCITDVLNSYEKEKLSNKKNIILSKLEEEISKEDKEILEKQLNDIIIKISKIGGKY